VKRVGDAVRTGVRDPIKGKVRLKIRLMVAAALAGFAPTAGAQTMDSAVVTFDSVWSTIRTTHYDTTYNGVDWAGVRDELRPRAAAVRNNAQLRGVIQEMLGRLKQSHFYLVPGDVERDLTAGGAGEAGDGDAGMELRLVDGRFLVTRVRAGGAAEAAGVRAGWVVEQLGETRAANVLATLARLPAGTDPRQRELRGWGAMVHELAGPAGSTVAARFLDARDRPVGARLVLRPAAGVLTKFGNLPPLRVTAEHELVALPGGTSAGVIRFNYWMPAVAAQIDDAVNELRGADGIVVDMRGNFGGVGGMAMGVAGHFTERMDTIGTMITRGGRLQFVANPRRSTRTGEAVRPFAGPVAILTDALSISTAEIFAGGLQKLGRARVFGAQSAGQALPSYAKRLPNGDVLVHAVADFHGPGGYRLEGPGVIPDVAAPVTREALLAGRDPALDAALRWIAEQKGGGTR
jgi:carboxyl-terminal processing protease